jgi:tRNA(Met) cytidine acetyltransferase
LLDDPDVRVYVLEHGDSLLGAALINREGGFDAALAEAIYRGERRPPGHLLPQTLSFHAGCRQAATLTYARIMRIAVHPQWQGKGLGSELLHQLVAMEGRQPVSAIGTSFGASAELLRFWQRAGFELVRMGFTRDHASGAYSAVMLRPLHDDAIPVFEQVRRDFRHALVCWLQGPLADVSEDVQAMLQSEVLADSQPLSQAERRQLEVFADSHRGVEACLWPLLKLVGEHEDLLPRLQANEQRVIRERLLGNRCWPEVVAATGVSGKSRAVELLRRAVKHLLLLSKP